MIANAFFYAKYIIIKTIYSIMTDKGLLIIDSREKYSGSSHKFTVSLGNGSMAPTIKSYTIKEMTIPHVFGNVSEHANRMRIQETGGAFDTILTIPVGQYSQTELLTALNSLITAIPGVAAGEIVVSIVQVAGFPYVSIATTRGQSLIVNSLINGTVEGEFGIEMLGIETDFTVPAASSLQSTTPVNLAGPSFVYITCVDLAEGKALAANGTHRALLDQVSLSGVPIGYTITKTAKDIMVDQFTFKNANNTSNLIVVVTDSKWRPLSMPSNYHVNVILRLTHQDP